MQVNFKDWLCNVAVTEYKGGALALVLNDAETRQRVAVATVNRPDAVIEPDHCFIKNYSENEGMLEALVDGGIVEDTGIRAQTGQVQVPLVRFLGALK